MKRKKRKCISTVLFQKEEKAFDQMIDLVCHEKLSYREKRKKKNLTLLLIAEWPVFLISCLMNYLQTPRRPFTLHLHLSYAPEEGALIYETLPWIQLCCLHLLCESDHVLHLREEWRASLHTSAPLWSQSNGQWIFARMPLSDSWK